jgi:hypothetical protein
MLLHWRRKSAEIAGDLRKFRRWRLNFPDLNIN